MVQDFTSLLEFVSGGSLLAMLLIASIKKFIKYNFIARLGDLGVQLTLFCISLIIAMGIFGWQYLPKEVALTTIMIVSGANAIYQILYKTILQKAILGHLDSNDK